MIEVGTRFLNAPACPAWTGAAQFRDWVWSQVEKQLLATGGCWPTSFLALPDGRAAVYEIVRIIDAGTAEEIAHNLLDFTAAEANRHAAVALGLLYHCFDRAEGCERFTLKVMFKPHDRKCSEAEVLEDSPQVVRDGDRRILVRRDGQ